VLERLRPSEARQRLEGFRINVKSGKSFALASFQMSGEERETAPHRGRSLLAPQAFFAAAAGAGAFRLCSSRREWSWNASTNSNTPKIRA
jgi:hypothetical protein